MIGCENSHNISDHKNKKILAVSRSRIDPNKGTFDWALSLNIYLVLKMVLIGMTDATQIIKFLSGSIVVCNNSLINIIKIFSTYKTNIIEVSEILMFIHRFGGV